MQRDFKSNVSAPTDEDWVSPNHVHIVTLLLCTLLGIYVCYLLTLPFLSSLAWAVSLAVLFAPLQRWLEQKLKQPSLSASIAVAAIGLIVIVPATFAIQQLALQVAQGARFIDEKMQSGEWREVFSSQPLLASFVDRLESQVDFPGSSKSLTAWLSNIAVSILKVSLHQLLDFCMTFYFLFFLLRDRRLAMHALCKLSPMTVSQMQCLSKRVNDTICATVYGSFVVAAVQGGLLALMFWWLGLPAPLLWGAVMGFFAIAPVAGAFLVWAPAAAYLALEGRIGSAIVLVLWGLAVIVVVDNLLRPVLVGRQLRIHTVFVFISVVGGMLLFGPSGMILGPIILTVTQVLLETSPRKPLLALSILSDAVALSRFENEGGALLETGAMERSRYERAVLRV